MSFLHSPQRIWLDLAIGIMLIAMLGFGSVYIYRLNNDARHVIIKSELAMHGQEISTDLGCVACHTIDGSPAVGPTWLGMWGRTETLSSGKQVVVDAEYFKKSLEEPYRQVVEGYPDVMQRYFLSAEETAALIAFAQSLSAP